MFQISEVLKKVPFFRTLGKDGIDFIVERLKFKPFEKDETICKIGDPGDKMYIIISGQVKVVVDSADAKEGTVIAHLTGGDYFGEMSLLTGEPRSASVITSEPSEMFILNKADFDVIVERYPSITLSMGKIISQRLRDTLQKAASKDGKNMPTSVKGSLSDRKLVEILKFSESNSLNGKIIVRHQGQTGVVYYKKGELQKVELGNLHEDEALDTLLNWENGDFVIEPDPLVMEKSVRAEQDVAGGNEEQQLLIISNSLVVQKMLQRTFENIGYAVYSTESKQKGLNLIQKLKPDVVIADTKLPDSEATDLINGLREITEIPVVLLTDNRNREKYSAELANFTRIYYTKNQEIGEILHTTQQIMQE